jgi:hypothetical protein
MNDARLPHRICEVSVGQTGQQADRVGVAPLPVVLGGEDDRESVAQGAALPYDENLQPKPAYYAIRDALSS